MVAVSPYSKLGGGANYTADATDYSLLATAEWLLGLGNLGRNDECANFPALKGLFNLSPTRDPLSASPCASVSSGDAPLTVAFTSNPSGGTPPYRYDWSFPDGATSDLVGPRHTFDRAGTFNVSLQVSDAAGNRTNASVFVDVHTVAPPSPPVFEILGLSIWEWAGVGALVAGGAVAVWFLRRRGRLPLARRS
ncbi:MAG: PKD domain-containing protein [Thermoplasmata archaeon]